MGINGRKEKIPFAIVGQSMPTFRMGGLGIRRLSEINISLLCKWLWALGDGKEKLWKRLIAKKKGKVSSGWYTKLCQNVHGYGFWKGILKYKDFFEEHV